MCVACFIYLTATAWVDAVLAKVQEQFMMQQITCERELRKDLEVRAFNMLHEYSVLRRCSDSRGSAEYHPLGACCDDTQCLRAPVTEGACSPMGWYGFKQTDTPTPTNPYLPQTS